MSACPSATKPCTIRVIRLDQCGLPVEGPKSVAITKGFINVAAAKEYEPGVDFYQPNAYGEACIVDKDPDVLKRINLDIGFCVIDHELTEIASSQRLLVGAAAATIGLATPGDGQTDGWSLEVWQKQSGANCVGGDEEWLWWAWPFITNGKVGDITMERAAFNFHITGSTKPIAGDDQWGADNRGPFPVLPATGPLIIGDHEAMAVRTTIQPPAAVCGATVLDLTP